MSFDFDAAVSAPFRMQPGLRRLAEGASQLTPNMAPERGTACHLREKLAVLQAFARQALLSRDGFDARPALGALAQHAAREHPQAFAIDTTTWRAPILGWAVNPAGSVHELEPGRTPWPEVGECLLALPAPWRRTALLSLAFAEDFAIIDGRDATIPWLAVALPSHWAPEHKVDRSFAEVHAPVADNRLITGAASQLARLVTGSERWERFVWTIARHPRLHAHPDRVDPTPWPAHLEGDALAALAWWRTERQSFIPVEGQHQAVFVIHLEVHPLAQALADPARAGRVHDALASMSPAVLEYRGFTAVHDRLLRWLAARSVS
ncbi:MAG TPA: heme-dependent oxidative N-demethylase subunit alpha family protein [Burkholderiaceae bacterium]|nr:heme-dependent oxidative N-demethylase subunit alpha family protein [Burkholderiaceae bacterium]